MAVERGVSFRDANLLATGDIAVDIYGYGRVLFQIITGNLSREADEKTRPVRCRRSGYTKIHNIFALLSPHMIVSLRSAIRMCR